MPPPPQKGSRVERTHESIKGNFLLEEGLTLSTISGNIDIVLLFKPPPPPSSSSSTSKNNNGDGGDHSNSSSSNPPRSTSHLTITSTSGSISIRTFNIGQHALQKSHCDLKTFIKTISGSIHVRSLHHGTSTTLSTVSGGINADLHPLRASSTPDDPSHVSISSTSGPIHYTLHPWPVEPNRPLRYVTAELYNVSDNIHATHDISWQGEVECDVVSGEIFRYNWKSLKVKEDGPKRLRGREGEREEKGGGGGKLVAQTASGCVQLAWWEFKQDRSEQYPPDPMLKKFGVRMPGEWEEFVVTGVVDGQDDEGREGGKKVEAESVVEEKDRHEGDNAPPPPYNG